MIKKHRHTKVIFTVGPASESEARLESLIGAGVDICRINMAHADHDWVRELVGRARSVCDRLGRQIAFMMDVKGPEIRTGDLDSPCQLEAGEVLDLTVARGVGGTGEDGVRRVDVNYPGFHKDVSVGDTVLVDNGLLRFTVLDKEEERVRCRVEIPGTLGNRRHINLPGVRVNLPALTKKDEGDIKVGISLGLEFYALSFVREATDIATFRRYLEAHESEARIIAKIEDQQAISNLAAIIEASDGLMIARGDLGIECPFEDLPVIQSRAVEACIKNGKPVIVATHMLESMIDSPMPTRAEVSDVSTAVREQADCIMLSGETTVGKYPLECVETMKRIAERMELENNQTIRRDLVLREPKAKMLRSAAYLASELEGAGIMVFTRSGFLAQMLSSLRPSKVPIYAFTDRPVLFRQLLLLWGIEPFLLEFNDDPEVTIRGAFDLLTEKKWVGTGTHMVIITNVIAGEKIIDTIQLRRVE